MQSNRNYEKKRVRGRSFARRKISRHLLRTNGTARFSIVKRKFDVFVYNSYLDLNTFKVRWLRTRKVPYFVRVTMQMSCYDRRCMTVAANGAKKNPALSSNTQSRWEMFGPKFHHSFGIVNIGLHVPSCLQCKCTISNAHDFLSSFI